MKCQTYLKRICFRASSFSISNYCLCGANKSTLSHTNKLPDNTNLQNVINYTTRWYHIKRYVLYPTNDVQMMLGCGARITSFNHDTLATMATLKDIWKICIFISLQRMQAMGFVHSTTVVMCIIACHVHEWEVFIKPWKHGYRNHINFMVMAT